jgi:hypothetical protein
MFLYNSNWNFFWIIVETGRRGSFYEHAPNDSELYYAFYESLKNMAPAVLRLMHTEVYSP